MPTPPPYPCALGTQTITLPAAVSHEIFHLAGDSGLAVATQRVMELTGANRQAAEAYVWALLKAR